MVLSLAFLVAIWPGAAGGSQQRAATVVQSCAPSGASRAVAGALRERLAQEGWVVRAAGDFGVGPNACSPDPVDNGRGAITLFGRAKEAFYDLKFKVAQKLLRTALNKMERAGPPASANALPEIVIHLAWTALELESLLEADLQFRNLARLWPDWQPDRSAFPPKVLDAFDATWQELAEKPRGSLEVFTLPPGATVYLNGRKSCDAPCTFAELLPGEHEITAFDPGAFPARLRVVVDPFSAGKRMLEMRPRPPALLVSQLGAGNFKAARALCSARALDAVIAITSARETEAALAVARCDTQEVHRSGERPMHKAISEVMGALGSRKRAGTDLLSILNLPKKKPPPRRRGSLLDAWWFWPAVGVVATAVSGGVGYAILRDPQDELIIIVSP